MTRGLAGVVVLVKIRDQYIRTFPGVGNRHRVADAAVTTCDNGPLSCEATTAFV